MKVRQSLFPVSMFAVYFGILLFMSGCETGLFVLMEYLGCGPLIEVIVPVIYWALVAMGITLFTRWKIRKTYEEPLHRMAEATGQVSQGNFSISVPTVHTAGRFDYLDVMILDFSRVVKEVGSSETLKTDFVSNVSHEMKTPISIIKSYARLLQDEKLSREQRQEYAQGIDKAVSGLSDLITNILKLNRLDHQGIRKRQERYDMCRQICDCIFLFEKELDEKEIDLQVDLEDQAVVTGDPKLVEMVWNNLISNAIKFTKRGGMIRISQTLKNGWAEVTVADTGCGIPKESLTHIFDKFYQCDTSHATEGNGLGLALVKRVVELEGGMIRVESREGEGTSFTVTLPQNRMSATQKPASEAGGRLITDAFRDRGSFAQNEAHTRGSGSQT